MSRFASKVVVVTGAAKAFRAEMAKRIPAGRLADPIEIARPILFLASEDASYMIGSELVVDGGYVAS